MVVKITHSHLWYLCIPVSARHSVWHLWRHDWTHQLSGNLLARWLHILMPIWTSLDSTKSVGQFLNGRFSSTGTRFVAVRVVRQWRIWGVVIEGFLHVVFVMLSCMFQCRSIQQSRDFQDGSTDSQPKQLGDLLTADDARPRALSLLEDAGRCTVGLSENRLLQDLMVN